MADRPYVIERFDGYIGTTDESVHTIVAIPIASSFGDTIDSYTCLLDVTVLSYERSVSSTSGGAAKMSMVFVVSEGTIYDHGDSSITRVGNSAVITMAGTPSGSTFLVQITAESPDQTQHRATIIATVFEPLFH